MTFEQLLLAAVEQRLLRPLDVQFALMVAQNDPPAVKLAAALLSRDAGEGHVCLPLSRLSGDEALSGKAGEIRDRLLAEAGAPEDWPALLLASSAVSCGDAPAPMILCGDRLYLNRMWRNELTVARFFNEANRVLEMDEARLASTLNALFPATGETDWQKVAGGGADPPHLSDLRRSRDREDHHRGEASGGADPDRRQPALSCSPGGANRESGGASDRIAGRGAEKIAADRRAESVDSHRGQHAASSAGRPARQPADALSRRQPAASGRAGGG